MACKCGGNKFTAHQRLYVDVVVDGDNYFVDNCASTLEQSVYEAENPYGPYTCLKCEQVYDELPQVKFLYYPGIDKWVPIEPADHCEKCGQLYAVHNDDGSCVED